jgi:hypothetical protein
VRKRGLAPFRDPRDAGSLLRGLARKGACPLFLVLAACANFDDLARNKPHSIVVTVLDTFHSDAGTVTVPITTELGAVTAYVNNADHGWSIVNGTWLDAGVALLDDVPPGLTYLIRPDDPVFFSIPTDAAAVDLGTEVDGPARAPASSGTVANFTVTNGVVPAAGTMMTARVPAFGLTVDNVTAFQPPAFSELKVPGPNTFVFSRDWSSLPLLQADTVELLELPQQAVDDAGTLLWAPQKRATVIATLANTQGTPVDVAMVDLPAGSVPSGSFDTSALVQAMETSVPDAGSVSVWVRTLLAPKDTASALTAQALYFPAPPGVVTAPALALDPLPGEPWTPLLQVQVFAESFVTVGGASETPLLEASAIGPIGDDSWQARALKPVTGITVDTSTGVLSPTLRWSGTAPSFAVATLLLGLGSNGSLTSQAVDFYVVYGNEVAVRPDVLDVGMAYLFLIESQDCGEVSRLAPLRTKAGLTCSNAFNRSDVYVVPAD